MKRIVLCLVALCLLLCACAAPEPSASPATTRRVEQTYPGFPDAPETFTGMREADLQPYFGLAQETYRRYVLATGLPELPQLPLQMSQPLQKYTALRFANETDYYARCEVLSIETRMGESFLGDAWQRSWKIVDGKLLCMPCVSIEFRYPGASFDSGSGQGAQMLIEDPRNPTLVDWFDFGDGKYSWDCQVRGLESTYPALDDPENWLGNCVLHAPADKIFD